MLPLSVARYTRSPLGEKTANGMAFAPRIRSRLDTSGGCSESLRCSIIVSPPQRAAAGGRVRILKANAPPDRESISSAQFAWVDRATSFTAPVTLRCRLKHSFQPASLRLKKLENTPMGGKA